MFKCRNVDIHVDVGREEMRSKDAVTLQTWSHKTNVWDHEQDPKYVRKFCDFEEKIIKTV